MPSRWVFNLIIFLTIASLGGIGFILVYKNIENQKCTHEDERVCKFIRSFRKEKFEKIQGVFTEERSGKEVKTEWTLNDPHLEMTMYQQNNELVTFIATKDYIYVKDRADGMWWQQRMSLDSYKQSLPIEPISYLKELQQKISKLESNVSFIERQKCSVEICYRYLISDPDDKTNQEYIYITTSNKLYRHLIAAESGTHELTLSYDSKEIARPEKIKVAEGNRNILLETLTEAAAKDIKPNYEYLQEFERARQESEEPTPTPSIDETPDPEVTE